MVKTLITALFAIAIWSACGPKPTEPVSPQRKVYLANFSEADVARFTVASIMNQPPEIIKVKKGVHMYVVSYTRKSDKQKFVYKVKINENRITWGNYDDRWRVRPDDEAITFSEVGDKLKITQTFPDGSTLDNEFKTEDKSVEEISTVEQKPTPKPIGKGKITTMADGMDVQRVNLWSSTGYDRVTTSHLTNGEKVLILKDAGQYYLIETANGDGRKGYCMKEFVIK
jgi:hypothetical protein